MIFMLCDGFTENLKGFNLGRLGSAMPFCFIYWIFDKCKALQWDWRSEVFWGRIKKYGMSLCLYQEGFCLVLLGIWAGTMPLSLIVVHYDSE